MHIFEFVWTHIGEEKACLFGAVVISVHLPATEVTCSAATIFFFYWEGKS